MLRERTRWLKTMRWREETASLDLTRLDDEVDIEGEGGGRRGSGNISEPEVEEEEQTSSKTPCTKGCSLTKLLLETDEKEELLLYIMERRRRRRRCRQTGRRR